jgi:predicted phosphohydrolase
MIIQYASDLHLEFKLNKRFLKTNPLQPKGDVLILAGDVVPFAELEAHNDFFDYLSDHFKTTYWLPGNHEYYQFDLDKKCGKINEEIRKNVHLVNNITIKQEGILFIFSTLWSNISPPNQSQLERSVHDFQAIKYNTDRLNVAIYNQQHHECLEFITLALQQETVEKKVVVTHHVPTLLNYPEKYKGTAMSDAFAVELYGLIQTTQPSCWIYGHHHFNTPDFNIGATQMLTNQLGYVKYGGDRYFSTDKILAL